MTATPNRVEGYLYCIADPLSGFHKIGITYHPGKRFRNIQIANPSVILVDAVRVLAMQSAERIAHRIAKEYRITGEWFDLPSLAVWIAIVDTLRLCRLLPTQTIQGQTWTASRPIVDHCPTSRVAQAKPCNNCSNEWQTEKNLHAPV